MYEQRHPFEIMLRGDGEGYDPRDIQPYSVSAFFEIVQGVFRDDGVRPRGRLRRPDRPFRFFVPRRVNFRLLNTEVWRRLQSGETLLDLDFSGWATN